MESKTADIQPETVLIEMTPKDARSFVAFRRYQHIWDKLPFIRGGKVILHIDENGVIKKHEVHNQFRD